MQKLFHEVASLDKRCYEEFGLSEDILMEHAANGMAEYIRNHFHKSSEIIIVCGSGNNGADGIALARLLHGDFPVSLFFVKEPKSEMAILQNKRTQAVGVKICQELSPCDVLIDAIVGTGFSGKFDARLQLVLEQMNELEAFKIACDVPSGLEQNGQVSSNVFEADVTLTMGALKKSLFLDEAKEFVGKIEVLTLGISREIYETPTNWNLLDLLDLQLPYRKKKNSHKGNYGHLALACGNKSGASIMSALSALKFGTGLVTLIGFEDEVIPEMLMYAHELPTNTTALACGMGLGNEFSKLELDKFLDNTLPLIADADIFHMPILLDILKREDVVLTPHPKEFVSVLKQTGIAEISVEILQKNRFEYVEKFCSLLPHVTLVLKGANVIIGKDNQFFINPHGTASLAKGGSGDILSGLIGALLAQGYTALEAAKNGSLAHTKLALNYQGADFSLTPKELIDGIGNL